MLIWIRSTTMIHDGLTFPFSVNLKRTKFININKMMYQFMLRTRRTNKRRRRTNPTRQRRTRTKKRSGARSRPTGSSRPLSPPSPTAVRPRTTRTTGPTLRRTTRQRPVKQRSRDGQTETRRWE